MKNELFDELLQSVKEAAAIERGAAKPSRQFEVRTANDVVLARLARFRTRLATGKAGPTVEQLLDEDRGE
jgi:hypothetical protein